MARSGRPRSSAHPWAWAILLGSALLAGFGVAGAGGPEATANGATLFFDSGQQLGSSDTSGVALGDLDGDGDLDAFTVTDGATDGPVVWINQGPGMPGEMQASAQLFPGVSSTAVVLNDFDGDLDLDAFVANHAAFEQLWLNDGSGVFTDAGQTGLGAEFPELTFAVAAADVDLDGDVDVVLGGSAGCRVLINQGGGQGGTEGEFTNGALFGGNPAYAVEIGPLAADPFPDLFVGFGGQPSGAAPDRVYFNDGKGEFLDTGQALGDQRSEDVVLADLDNDADLDAFVVGNQATSWARVYLNQGGVQGGNPGDFVDTGQSLPLVSSSGAAATGDFDADGDADVFVGNIFAGDRVWLNDGLGAFSDSGLSLGADWSRDVGVGAIDQGDTVDLFVAVGAGGPDRMWWGQAATGSGPSGYFYPAELLVPGSVNRLASGDVDGDDDVDLLTARLGPPTLYLNQGGAQGGTEGTFEPSTEPPLTGCSPAWYEVALADLDGDSNLDTFMATDQRLSAWLGDGSGGFTLAWCTVDPLGLGDLVVADFGGGGDPDVLVVGSFLARVYINQGDGTFVPMGQVLPGPSRYAAGDLDGDGDADLVGPGAGGQYLAVWINDGAGVFAEQLELEDGSLPVIADFDGDGDLDVHAWRRVSPDLAWIWENDGRGGLSAAIEVAYTNEPMIGITSGDLDGDGVQDLVTLELSVGSDNVGGVPRVFLARTAGQTTYLSFNHQCLARLSDLPGLWLADIDGYGGLDILVDDGLGLRVLRGGAPAADPPARCCAAERVTIIREPPVAAANGPESTTVETPMWARGVRAIVAGMTRIDLEVFYRVRDELLPAHADGQWMLDFYDTWQEEVLTLLITDAGLRQMARDALVLWQDNLQAVLDGQGELAVVTQEQVDAVQLFLDQLTIGGSPELAGALTEQLAELPPLDDLVDMNMDEVVEEGVGPPVLVFEDGFESGDTSAWSHVVGD
jgi:FG-GAP-like repeat